MTNLEGSFALRLIDIRSKNHLTLQQQEKVAVFAPGGPRRRWLSGLGGCR